MAVCWILCLLCCHLVLTTASNSLRKGDKKPSKNALPVPNAGVFENCGEPSTDLGMTITPGIARFGDTLSIDAHLTSSLDVKEGYLNASIYIDDEVDPLYQTPLGQGHFTCDDIHKYLPFLCPFPKNKKVTVDGYKLYLKPSLGLPAGNFRILLYIQDMERNNVLCTYGHVVILDD